MKERRYSNADMTLWIRLDARGGDIMTPLTFPLTCRRDTVLHAAHSDHALDWIQHRSRRITWDTACGGRAHPQFSTVEAGGDLIRATIPWPPYVAPLREAGLSRCIECHRATGSLRPKVTLTAREVGSTDD